MLGALILLVMNSVVNSLVLALNLFPIVNFGRATQNFSATICFMGAFHGILCRFNLTLTSEYSSGTSWGAIPFHGVYTSYDYGASVCIIDSLGIDPTLTHLYRSQRTGR
jgi:hypothetical protein